MRRVILGTMPFVEFYLGIWQLFYNLALSKNI